MSYPYSKDVKSLTFAPALACVKMMAEHGIHMDITAEDFEFLTGPNLWLYTEQTRARQCIESAAYGGLDVIGFPRFPLPAEFVAAVIFHFVHPCNRLAACRLMETLTTVTNCINGVDKQVNARQMFALVCGLAADNNSQLYAAEAIARVRYPITGDALEVS